MEKADADVVILREEQERLLESLMFYLLYYQDANKISSDPCKEILAPLCIQAGKIRAKMPQAPMWQDESDDSEEEGELPLHKKPYPSVDGTEMDSWMPKDDEGEKEPSEVSFQDPEAAGSVAGSAAGSSVPLYQNMPSMTVDHSS